MFITTNIKALRKLRGLSQQELAAILSVKNTSISAYERGENLPSPEVLMRLAAYFQVLIDDLFYLDLSDETLLKKGFSIVKIPLVESVEIYSYSSSQDPDNLLGYLQVPLRPTASNGIAAIIGTNTLYPELSKGDVAICIPSSFKSPMNGLYFLSGDGFKDGLYRVEIGTDSKLSIGDNTAQYDLGSGAVSKALKVVSKLTGEGLVG